MKCQKCSNRQNYDGTDRCARYHDSKCTEVIKYCKGKHFLNINKGISLYAMKNWLNRLTKEEMELPLTFQIQNTEATPKIVIRTYNKHGDHWIFHAHTTEDQK